eukprot:TRINITY_DN18796_c0_g1_i1.p1 TRINITY_DN18796_c0_g1~~TRINITY_DN18796_c0_g1_i1.p1  ORF type:complete len:176 (+),score=44.80 TRINITY_DN18796_c0_g1_i1:240-767(+)
MAGGTLDAVPLRPTLVYQWAEAHKGIPAAAVGFDALLDDTWVCLQNSTTPEDLGWKPGGPPVRLLAYPADAQFVGTREDEPVPAPKRQKQEDDAKRASKSPPVRAAAPKRRASTDVGGDEPIEFLQANPKKPNSATWTRYEKYKAAKTMNEAISLGAAKGDIREALQKGWCKKLC